MLKSSVGGVPGVNWRIGDPANKINIFPSQSEKKNKTIIILMASLQSFMAQ